MNTPQTIYLKDYTPPDFLIDRTDLTFDIFKDHTIVTSKLSMRKNPDSAVNEPSLVLDKGPFDILEVTAGGMVLLPGEYETDDETFRLANTPEQFELEIKTKLLPDQNTTLEGLYVSGNILCSQCEAQGFRRITPYLDRPDVMSIYSCTIIADKKEYPVLLSNGNLIKEGDLDNGRHYARWEDPFKKPSYLFAIVAGDLAHITDQFTTRSGQDVALKIYSEAENIDKCHHAMACLKQAMKWDETRFRLEYDLDLFQIVAINDFNAGAMENKGLNIFNAKYVLADSRSATDDDFLGIQSVIAHEYFHNWTGNRVTLKNWFQLSLKEGLTVFRDQEFSSDLNSRGVKRISDVRNLRAFQFPEDSGPMAHPVRPDAYIKMDNFYTMTVYEKGAELVRMIHCLLGETLFQKGMDLYFEQFDGMAVTIEDFIQVMQTASGKNLDLFSQWYFQSGTPIIHVTREYDEATQKLKLIFRQEIKPDHHQKDKKPLHIPVLMGIVDKNGKDLIPEDKALLELTQEKQTFEFKDIPAKSFPSVFRKFSAPVKIVHDFTDEELGIVMSLDTDEFNRWDAAQTLFINEIKRLVDAFENNNQTPQVSSELIEAFSAALARENTDRSFLARMLALPKETEIKDHFDIIPVESIHKARLYLKRNIAEALKDGFLETVDKCKGSLPDDISHAAVADRSLKNLALSYLGAQGSDSAGELIMTHFTSAANMTDEMAAFTILANMDPAKKESAAERFYDRWKDNPLVLDKWFAVQAASMLDDTPEQVLALTSHPAFSIKNPNKVRALIYMFAIQNPFHFHEKNGRGYRFIADRILELDQINHQVAARLSSCFSLWKRYDTDRRGKMEAELRRIKGTFGLSKNVFEIISKSLEN